MDLYQYQIFDTDNMEVRLEILMLTKSISTFDAVYDQPTCCLMPATIGWQGAKKTLGLRLANEHHIELV